VTGLNGDDRATVNGQVHGFGIAKREQSVAQVTRPSDLLPPVRWWTPPSDSIWLPYSAVVTWPMASPWARTVAPSGPRKRSVSIFTLTPQ
jgi:hypothetical protein